MPSRISEAIVLKTFPYGEADLIVSYFTRESGKLRGAAKRARRPKSPFGAGLERMSHVRMSYFQRENRDLTNLDSCEIIRSPFSLLSVFEASVALDYITEVSEELLPAEEPNERFFRLLLAVLDFLHDAADPKAAIWPAVLYFHLWAVRLSGVLPGLEVSEESVQIATEMFTTPIKDLPERQWSKATAADLRHFLQRVTIDHIERRLMTLPVLEGL